MVRRSKSKKLGNIISFSVIITIASVVFLLANKIKNEQKIGKSVATNLQRCEYVLSWGSLGSGDGKFNKPSGIAVNASGTNVWVADTENNRIQQFASDGTFQRKWGSLGGGNSQFNKPIGVYYDDRSVPANIYVVDTGNYRIQKFNNFGRFIGKWGSYGKKDGQFDKPRDIAADSKGNIYVADTMNHRIQKFDPNGKFISKWGSPGSGSGQFNQPQGVALDLEDNVYVADGVNNRVQEFDSNGNFLAAWVGSKYAFNLPAGIDVKRSEKAVYVADSFDHSVNKYNTLGVLYGSYGSFGSKEGQLSEPRGIGVDQKENVFVGDTGNSRIVRFRCPPLKQTN